MSGWSMTAEEVGSVVVHARALVAANERRNVTSKNATLSEEDALFNLWLALGAVIPEVKRGV